jgi:hypothetical protein
MVYASEWDRTNSETEPTCRSPTSKAWMPEDTDVEDANPELLWESLNTADLEDFEQALFKDISTVRKFFLSATAQEFINPQTGRPYTKTTATNRFRHPLKPKVRDRYQQLIGEAA